MSRRFASVAIPLPSSVRPDVLLVTATDVELNAVLALLEPEAGSSLFKTHGLNLTYYLGRYGGASAVVIKCDMGSVGRDSSFAACFEALAHWRPRALIVLGIAFGKDEEKQRICDVLVAKHLIPYESARVGRRNTAYRSAHPPSDPLLLDRFTNATTWRFRYDGQQVRVIPGPVLTGEKLVDNATLKRRMLRAFPHAIGGEMEGIGAFNAAARHRVPCILVKSICDWADGNKNDRFQRSAAKAAASLVRHVLSEPGALGDLPVSSWPGGSGTLASASPAIEGSSQLAPTIVLTELPQPRLAPPVQDAERVTSLPSARMAFARAASTASEPTRTRPTMAAAPVSPAASQRRALLLNRAEIALMGLIATAPQPLPIPALRAFFPTIRWRPLARALATKGAVAFRDRDTPTIPPRMIKTLLEDARTRSRFEAMWFRRLQELKRHPDTAILLGLVHLRAGRVDLAITTLTDIAEGLEPGNENQTYRDLLSPFLHPAFLRRLTPKVRVRLLNAFALCLSRSGRRDEAIRYFEQLARVSRQAGDRWGLGQSYINRGVTYYEAGDIPRAARCYERAVRHGQETRDRWLLGRSLHNLGMLRVADNPDEGLALIRKGYRIKLSIGDIVGAIGSVMGEGFCHSARRHWREALASYRRAVTLARRLDLRHLLGLALANVGSSLVDLGTPGRGLAAFREARQIGEREGFRDVVRYAVQGQAVVDSKRNRFKSATRYFLELAEVHRASADRRSQTMALHDAGVVAARAGLRAEAARAFAASRHLAEREGDEMAVYRSRQAELTALGLDPMVTARRLNAAASAERRRGHPFAAAKLWEASAGTLFAHQHPARERMVTAAAQAALRCFEQLHRRADAVRIYQLLYAFRRDNGQLLQALNYARLIEKVSRSTAEKATHALALDEQACCHQQLGQLAVAERLHKKALRIAAGTGSATVIATSLNNLGLLFRNAGRLAESIKLLRRAGPLVESAGDIGFAATVAKNLALALDDAGRSSEAERILRTWATATRRLKLSAHYASMLHGLANLAYTRGQITKAASLYAATLKEAERGGAEQTATEAAHNYLLLLTDDIHRFFHKRDSKSAINRLNAALRITRKYSLVEQSHDLLVTAARGYWWLGPGRYPDAARTYILSMADLDVTREQALGRFSSVGAELALNVYRLPSGFTEDKLEELVARTRRWLQKHFGSDMSAADEGVLLWPLTAGAKLRSAARSGSTLSSEAITNVLVQEFTDAIEKMSGRPTV